MAAVFERISHYQIGDRLGSGGMGTVYRATDVDDGSVVAVKVLRAGLVQEAGYLQRFKREAHIATSLDSPHIVRVLSSGEENGTYFIAMEYVEGQSLDRVLSGGRLDQEQAVRFARQVALALREANDHGVVHRDIKPQNILITPAGEVRVTDFGVARIQGDAGITTDGLYLGTPEYMSPEQINGQSDTRADIYSLGIVLYQMLTGKVPYSGETPWKTLDLQVRAPVPRVAASNRGVEPWLDALVARCMAKDPRQRYQSPDALVDALDSREVTALPAPRPSERASPGEPPVGWSQRSRRTTTSRQRRAFSRTIAWIGALGGILMLVVLIAASGGAAALLGVVVLAAGGLAVWTVLRRPNAPVSASYHLLLADGRRVGLRERVSTLGRDPGNDIVLTDPSVSRQHARFVLSAGRVFIEDAGSQNGTYLNGRRVRRASVRQGDQVSLGGQLIVIEASVPHR